MAIIVRRIQRMDVNNGLVDVLNNLSPTSDAKRLARTYWQWSKGRKAVYVAIDDSINKVIGTGSIFIEHKPTHDPSKPVGHIEDVVVLKSREKEGVGTKIMQALIAHAKSFYCRKIILSCTLDNTSYYAKFGFVSSEVSMRLDL